MIKFLVMGEPRGKQRPKGQLITGIKSYIHIYTPQATLNYENYIKLSYLDAKIIAESKGETFSYLEGQPLEANIKIYQGIPKSTSKKKSLEMLEGHLRPTKKPDIDNILKIIFDGLNGIAFKDDTQVIRVISEKYFSQEPRVEIEIKELIS